MIFLVKDLGKGNYGNGSTNIAESNLLEINSDAVLAIDNITEIPNRSYNDLQDLPALYNVIFVADVASLPVTGVVDILYVAKAENTLHEWNGASYDTLGGGGSSDVIFVTDVASLPGTGVVDTLYIAKAENSLHEWNGASYDTLGGGGGGTPARVTLTDTTTLTWDLSTEANAKLTATSGVGNTRTIPNTTLTNGVDGENYNLLFVQDATGGRTIAYESNFVVVGALDTRANQVSIITMQVQDGIGYVVQNSFEGLVSGLSNIGTGSVLLTGSNIKSIAAGTDLSIADDGSTLTISYAGGGGATTNTVYKYVYVDATLGNDGTGVVEDPTLPFATIDAAIGALPADDLNEHVWILQITHKGTYTMGVALPDRNFGIVSAHEVTINITTNGLTKTTPSYAQVFIIDLPDGIIDDQVTGSPEVLLDDANVYIRIKKLIKSSNFGRAAFSRDLNSIASLYLNIGEFVGTTPISGTISGPTEIKLGHCLYEADAVSRALVDIVVSGNNRGKIEIGYAKVNNPSSRGGLLKITKCDAIVHHAETHGADTLSAFQYQDYLDLVDSTVHCDYADLTLVSAQCMNTISASGHCVISGNYYNGVSYAVNSFMNVLSGSSIYLMDFSMVGLTNSDTANVNSTGFISVATGGYVMAKNLIVKSSQIPIFETTGGTFDMIGVNILETSANLFSSDSTSTVNVTGKIYSNSSGGGSGSITHTSTLTEL